MSFRDAPGSTPLDPDETEGLIPAHLMTQGALNAWEQANMALGAQWAISQAHRDLLTEGFIRELHHQMFSKTWRWAGTFRKSNKNIGVDWTQISMRLRDLLDNSQYQIQHGVYDADEMTVRLHHQLVWIHPFPNGNGRHARLVADLLALRLGRPRLTWGSGLTPAMTMKKVRDQYLLALRAADQGQVQDLIRFARS